MTSSAAIRGANAGTIDPRTLSINPPAKGGEGGEGGVTTVTNADLVALLQKNLPEGSVLALCSKGGDPTTGAWPALAAENVRTQCPAFNNNYINCSSFKPLDGKLAATAASFAAYHALMLDDVGTKVPVERLRGVIPTWKLETSPGNYQVGFVLKDPIADPAKVKLLQDAIVRAELCDPGAVGIARWARLPVGINGKAKYAEVPGKPFRCKLVEWHPDVAFTWAELAAGLSLDLTPPSPPSKQPIDSATGARPRQSATSAGYVPRPATNPVVTALREHGLYKQELAPGKHDVTCPWVDQHTDQQDSGTAYFEPSLEHPTGGFCCQHSHKNEYRLPELLDRLGLTAQQARGKAVIRVRPGDLGLTVRSAEHCLATQGSFFQAGGAIVTLRPAEAGVVKLQPLSEQALTFELATWADWEKQDAKGAWVRCDPPVRNVNLLFRADKYEFLQPLLGVARQPFFREQDGQLVTSSGYDAVSSIYGTFDEGAFPPIGTTREDAEKALASLRDLLKEFHFARPHDEAAALSAMLTGAIRPSLPLAPAFNITASAPGSGKTYLCTVIHPFAGPDEPLNVSYPKTSEEATKAILSLLLQKPVAIVFDDMDADWQPFGAINRMLTSRTMTDRVLGVSKVITVGTNTLVLGSGNNIEPVRDLRRRVISIRLAPKTSTPMTLKYGGRPADAVRQNRNRYVAEALTIVAAFRQHGSPQSEVPPIATFDDWSRDCRHSLLWLGLPDPAQSLLDQVKHDPSYEALDVLFRCWHSRFGSKAVMVRTVIEAAHKDSTGPLADALGDLPIMEQGKINPSKFGWYLKKHANLIVGGFELSRVDGGERTAWSVQPVSEPESVCLDRREGPQLPA